MYAILNPGMETPHRTFSYHSPEDKEIPSTFFCLECRLGRDAHFETLRSGYPRLYEAALSKYQDLCLFRCGKFRSSSNKPWLTSRVRRSIKSVQQYKPRVFVDFKKVLGMTMFEVRFPLHRVTRVQVAIPAWRSRCGKGYNPRVCSILRRLNCDLDL